MLAITFGETASVFREKHPVRGYFAENVVVKESTVEGLGVFCDRRYLSTYMF